MALLEVKNLSISFGGLKAVDNFQISIEKGQLYGLIGPNGAGKTTAFNCVTGIYQPTYGSVSFHGEIILADTPQGKMRRLYAGDVAPQALTPVRKTPDEVTKLGIARTFQNIRLFGNLTVFDNVLIAKHMRARQNVFSATLRLTVPILFVAVGGCFGSKANVFNIGLESYLGISAFFAMCGSYWSQSPWVGLLLGMLAGLVMSCIFAVFVLYFGATS